MKNGDNVTRKISLFLMNKKGLSVLQTILEEFGPDSIDCVISARDEGVKKDYYKEIADLCFSHGLRVFSRQEQYQLKGKFTFAIGWRWIIKEYQNLIIFHDALLPRYRGFAPLVSSLINGEQKIGVSALLASNSYDEGDIIAQRVMEIQYPIKIAEAIDLLLPLYNELARIIARDILRGNPINSVPQDHQNASYCLWRDEKDYQINWHESSQKIHRFIDAVGFPYKGAQTFIDGKQVRVLEAVTVPDVMIENRDSGKVVFFRDNCPVVVCSQGLLKITKMIDEVTQESILPLKKIRVRFSQG